jgi:hypothetical protein
MKLMVVSTSFLNSYQITDPGYSQTSVDFGSTSDYFLNFYNPGQSGVEFNSPPLWRNGQNPPIASCGSWENMYENMYASPPSASAPPNLYSLEQHVPENSSFNYSQHSVQQHSVYNGYGTACIIDSIIKTIIVLF